MPCKFDAECDRACFSAIFEDWPYTDSDGGQKHDEGKPMLHLIPPEPLLAVAEVLTDGAGKYPAAHNWATVPNARERYYNAALRHLLARSMGEPLDDESGSPHIAHAVANLLFFLHFDLQDFGDGWPAPMPEPHPTA